MVVRRASLAQSAPDSKAARVADADASLATGAIYTANKGASSISRIDLASGQVVMFPIGLVPHNVQVSADGRSIVAVDHIAEFAPEIGGT